MIGLLRELRRQVPLIVDLAQRDYRQQNKGSYLGVVWNYLQPILFVSVLYLIFTSGFRIGADTDIPFGLYLASGMVCWLFFASNLSAMCNVLLSYRFLVKKVDFPLAVLPLVPLLGGLLPHLVLSLLIVLVAAWQGLGPSVYLLQFVYYFGCVCVLLVAIGWLTSSTRLFVSDVANVISVCTQFGFWLTPVVWHIESMPVKLQVVLKLIPTYYLASGYRDAMFGGRWFWERGQESVVFWLTTLSFLLVGRFVFKKLKPHFAEVL